MSRPWQFEKLGSQPPVPYGPETNQTFYSHPAELENDGISSHQAKGTF